MFMNIENIRRIKGDFELYDKKTTEKRGRK